MMDNMQAMMDGLSAQWMRERAKTQMTLGKLIDRLEELSPDVEVDAFCSPHSYRGYYCDLAFEGTSGKTTPGDLLTICRECMGEVFCGYKGGDFQMGRNTPVWLAAYGTTGRRIMAIGDGGELSTAEEDDE